MHKFWSVISEIAFIVGGAMKRYFNNVQPKNSNKQNFPVSPETCNSKTSVPIQKVNSLSPILINNFETFSLDSLLKISWFLSLSCHWSRQQLVFLPSCLMSLPVGITSEMERPLSKQITVKHNTCFS